MILRWGHLKIVQFLVDGKHSNVEAKNKERETPLHLAAWYDCINNNSVHVILIVCLQMIGQKIYNCRTRSNFDVNCGLYAEG